MRKTYFTLLFASLMAFSASAQQTVKTVPAFAPTKAPKAMLAAPANVPTAIDDKAKGVKIYSTQISDESKFRSWMYFYDKTPAQLNRIKIFDQSEPGTQYYGLHLGAWGGDKYYGFYGAGPYNVGNSYWEWRSFDGLFSVDVHTGELTRISDMRIEGTTGDLVGAPVYYGRTGEQEIPVFRELAYNPSDDMIYGVASYQADENTNATSRIYTINKETGEWTKVVELEDQIMDFCFDYDGNMYSITPYWKPTTEDGTTIYTWSGTYLTKWDSNFERVDGKKFRIKNLENSDIYANSYGSLEFDHTTGTLYFSSLIAGNNDGSSNYDRLVILDPETGKYVESNTFMSGNEIVGMYIPYFAADDRGAAARVSDFTATPSVSGDLNVALSWKNPTKTWNAEELTELAEVQVYRKKADVTACAESSEEIYNNSELIATVPAGNDKIGQTMTWTDDKPLDGMNTYYIVPCRVSGEKGVPDSVRCVAGLDVPGVPANVVAAVDGQNVKLTWDAPTDGLHNGYINQADLKYDIVRNPGNEKIGTDITATTFTDESVSSLDRSKFIYTIVAKNAKGESDPVESNEIEAGMAPLPPVSFGLNSEEDANQWTAFENFYGDYQKWEWAEWKKSYRLITAAGNGEDWTASPAFRLEKGKTYLFTSKFRNDWPDVGHTIGRYVGTAPTLEGMTNLIGEEKEYSASSSYENNPVISYEDKFTAPEDGTYYFGFRVADNTEYDVLYFYGVDIETVYANDLKAVELQAYGEDVVSGDMNNAKIVVKNNGAETVEAGSYSVRVLQKANNGDVYARCEATNTPAIRPGSTAEIAVEFTAMDEGECDFAVQVIFDKDEFNGNNISDYKKINVVAYGEATPWSMVVTDGDEWNYTYFPFAFADTDDGSQSIYTKNDLADNPTGHNTIERIGYLYDGNASDALQIPGVKVWMANTDLTSFSSADDWMDESNMTQVFSGDVTVYPGTNNLLSLQLNTPFEYDPTKSLLICVEHQSTVTSMFPCAWRTFNQNGMRNKSIRYWSPKTRKYLEKPAPVLYVGFTPNRPAGIEEVNGNAAGNVYYNAKTGKLMLNGAKAEVYDLSGKLLRSYSNASEVAPNLPAGMYIVKSNVNGNVNSVKVSINK